MTQSPPPITFPGLQQKLKSICEINREIHNYHAMWHPISLAEDFETQPISKCKPESIFRSNDNFRKCFFGEKNLVSSMEHSLIMRDDLQEEPLRRCCIYAVERNGSTNQATEQMGIQDISDRIMKEMVIICLLQKKEKNKRIFSQ